MSTESPIILVVTDRKSVTSGAWSDIENDALPHTYIDAIERAGGLPIMLPPVQSLLDSTDRLLDLADGIFLAGGRDLDPDLYGHASHPLNDTPLRVRDELEIALARGAHARGMPMLGACRGMQIMNVAFGGTLEQHLGDRLDMTPHRDVVGEFTSHAVSLVPGGRLAGILESHSFDIASHHHQSIDNLGAGLVVSAYASDGVVEAVEAPGEQYAVGVQWHPEERLDPEGLRIVASLVTESAKYRTSRTPARLAAN
ncbi:gamma-glutamyl-gamma-aminobutyrate hydrolase family protein [Arthrobacter methylotrophus]|uniref:Gamma-glutamyl-gamma-aminobutyrate hydrolase family protein n=1 Tax=Arthrobacter methylotrophus TaxID=121291 RepID=A0ABV5UQA0_9MICC